MRSSWPGSTVSGPATVASPTVTETRSPSPSPRAAAKGGGDGDPVLPGQLVERLGQFLEPGIVGVDAVPDRRIRPHQGLDGVRRCGFRQRRGVAADRRRFDRGRRGIRHVAVVQGLDPGLLVESGPGGPDRIARSHGRRAGEQAQHLMHRAALVERPDRRLDERRGSVRRAPVRPALKGMGERQMPVREIGRFVRPASGVEAQRHPAQQVDEPQGARRRIGRVGIDRDQGADRPVSDRLGQVLQAAIRARGLDHRFGELDRATDRAQPPVDREGKRLDRRRKMAAGQDQRVGPRRLQRLGGALQPEPFAQAEIGRLQPRADAEPRGQLRRQGRQPTLADRQARGRARAGQAGRGLGEPTGGSAARGSPAPPAAGRPSARRAPADAAPPQRVGAEADHRGRLAVEAFRIERRGGRAEHPSGRRRPPLPVPAGSWT